MLPLNLKKTTKTHIYRVFHDFRALTAGGDFLGFCDQKIHINMCLILDGYGVMGVF